MVNIVDTQISVQQLEFLKQLFKRVIDSRRIFDKIQSLKDLIHIFKKRDYVLQPLYDQLIIINKTVSSPKPSASPNTLSEQRIHPLPILPNIPCDPIERIDQLIANEIGQKWKDFARALRIPEGKIDEFSSVRLVDTIKEILQYHRSSEHMWKTTLCIALSKARRKDLSIEVQKIFELHQMN